MDAVKSMRSAWNKVRGMANRNRAQQFSITIFLLLVAAAGSLKAQEGEQHQLKISDILLIPTDSVGTKKHPKHKALETELEIYPFNLAVPGDAAIKNEVMFDYHIYSDNERCLAGIRYFTLVNTHYKHDREMRDLLMYTEAYYGFPNFQLGAEIGSITGVEYFSIGPQFTIYDNKIFKRVSLTSRVWPDLVIGYEVTTQELRLNHNLNLSLTGMGRVVLPFDEQVIQVSTWLSFEKIKGLFVGFEYEYNNAEFFNNHPYERNHEFFLGLKVELH